MVDRDLNARSYVEPAFNLLAGRATADVELVWAQEEPRTMGAWRFVREAFLDGVIRDPGRRTPRYVGRPASAGSRNGMVRSSICGSCAAQYGCRLAVAFRGANRFTSSGCTTCRCAR